MSDSATLTVEDLVAHAPWARRLARSLVGEADSDDLVQETWLSALRRRPNTDRPLRAWLQRVLQSRGANRRRDQARLRARHDAAAASGALPAVVASPEELLAQMQLQRLLASAVIALGEPLRETLLLRYYTGLSSSEIAAQTGVPAGTVRRRLKEAIAEVRAALDRDHAGNRNTWLRALAPFLPTDGPRDASAFLKRTPAASLAIGKSLIFAGALATAAAAWLLPWPARETAQAESGGNVGRPPPQAPGSTRRPGGGRSLAAITSGFRACEAQLQPLRERLVAAEARRRTRLKVEELYEEGAPNPLAQAALAPDFERIMRPFAPATTYSLECRTFLCRVRIVQAPNSSIAWKEAIQRDPELRPRIRGGSFRRLAPTTDAVTGAALEQGVAYLRLAHPAGELVPLDVRAAPLTLPAPPPPTNEADCLAQLELSRQRLAELDAVPEEPHPEELFAKATPNSAATGRLAAIVARALAGGAVAYPSEVECRGQSCRVIVPGWMLGESARDWRTRLLKNPEFRQQLSGGSMDVGAHGLFFTLAAVGRGAPSRSGP